MVTWQDGGHPVGSRIKRECNAKWLVDKRDCAGYWRPTDRPTDRPATATAWSCDVVNPVWSFYNVDAIGALVDRQLMSARLTTAPHSSLPRNCCTTTILGCMTDMSMSRRHSSSNTWSALHVLSQTYTLVFQIIKYSKNCKSISIRLLLLLISFYLDINRVRKKDRQYFGRNFDKFKQLVIIFSKNHPDNPCDWKIVKCPINTCTTLRSDDVCDVIEKCLFRKKINARIHSASILWPPKSPDLNTVD